MHSVYEIALSGKGDWNFVNESARNVINFAVDDSSLYHTDNCKINFLVFGEGDTFGSNGSFDALEKYFHINLSKGKIRLCFSLHCNGDNSYLFVNGKKIYKFTSNNKNINFPTQFCLGSKSNKFRFSKSIFNRKSL